MTRRRKVRRRRKLRSVAVSHAVSLGIGILLSLDEEDTVPVGSRLEWTSTVRQRCRAERISKTWRQKQRKMSFRSPIGLKGIWSFYLDNQYINMSLILVSFRTGFI